MVLLVAKGKEKSTPLVIFGNRKLAQGNMDHIMGIRASIDPNIEVVLIDLKEGTETILLPKQDDHPTLKKA